MYCPMYQFLGTYDSLRDWFAAGEYKRLANEVGGEETALPAEVHKQMKELLASYNALKQASFDDILDFHVQLERIHPFQNGNGRSGRLVMFWQCLKADVVPFIITEELHLYHYRGIQQWGKVNGYLRHTCLVAQVNYKALLDYFKPKSVIRPTDGKIRP